uniref:Mirror-image polydactyly 1 n=1 Tax=Salarias fasciatus TaxID=181472 RepID=A0A672I6W0_SALFA
MYKDNPRVNEELRRRLPSPARQQLSNTAQQLGSTERLEVVAGFQAPQPLTEVSPVSHRRSASPVSPLLNRSSVSPISIRRSVSPVSPLSHRRSVSPVSPLSQRRSASPLSGRAAGAVGGMEEGEEFSPGRGASPRADWPVEGAVSSPAPRRHLLSADSRSSARRPNEDKNISLLLKELDSLRLTNSTLQEQLVLKEKELRSREVDEKLKEELQEVQRWERPTALLEEVLAAQKQRDQALMSRLLLANEERDEALLRVRRLQQAAETDASRLDTREQDVDELLRRVCHADSAHEIRHAGSALVQRLRLAWQRRNDITAQEMNAVMEERDASVVKVSRAATEPSRCSTNFSLWTVPRAVASCTCFHVHM